MQQLYGNYDYLITYKNKNVYQDNAFTYVLNPTISKHPLRWIYARYQIYQTHITCTNDHWYYNVTFPFSSESRFIVVDDADNKIRKYQ